VEWESVRLISIWAIAIKEVPTAVTVPIIIRAEEAIGDRVKTGCSLIKT